MSTLETSLPDLAERNFIDGKWTFTREGYALDIYDPSRSEVIAAVPLSTHRDVRRAIDAAGRALGPWSARPAAERARLVGRSLDHLEAELDGVAELTARDVGLPAPRARADLERAIAVARERLLDRAPGDDPGIIGQILAWSSPLVVSLDRLVPGLARGNVAVVKPSLRAPLSLVPWVEALERSDLPPGVLNLVQGTGLDVGAALARSPALRRLDFVGSRAVARRVELGPRRTGVAVAAQLRAVQERPLAHDADLEAAAARIADVAFGHAARPGFGGLRVEAPPGRLDALTRALWPRFAAADFAGGPDAVAPLPTESARAAAELGRSGLLDAGARVVCASSAPDPRTQRMGWFLPAQVLRGPSSLRLDPEVPYGPLVLLAETPEA